MKKVCYTMRHVAILALIGVAMIRPAGAHPHIFVEAGIEVMVGPDGTPTALRISWTYDAFFSMLLLSDMGLDADFDGVLTDAEWAELDGFDMNWIDGYHGDTHVMQDGTSLELTGPISWTSDFDGEQLRSTHIRRFVEPPDAGQPWDISVHDPSYYTRYTLADAPKVTGLDACMTQVIPPDLDQAEARLSEELDALADAGLDAEVEFPEVGALFAETVRISCRAQ
jgi:polyphosphate kinase